ncbi:hypothetical protein ACSNOJ_13725 [Streptomyces sp. URMC 128]|uniref:hypothetical protein n=1 Tax=Streptomyces sp. URMC 128 TaxID=3423404 RepID=UPI003F1D0DEC
MEQRDPERSEHSIDLRGRASGHGQVYQAAGDLHIHRVQEDIGLVELRAWITRIVGEFETRDRDRRGREARQARESRHQLDLLRSSLEDHSEHRQVFPSDAQGGKDALRRLLASGVARYLARSAPPASGAPLPEQVIVEIATVALWHVTLAPSLPDGWFDDLQYLTSPMLARSVRDARAARTGLTFESFARSLAGKPLGVGLLNLFDDLGDPRRGGPALTALALAGHMDPPPRRGGAKAIVGWVLAGALGAGSADHADKLVNAITSETFRGLDLDIDIDLN